MPVCTHFGGAWRPDRARFGGWLRHGLWSEVLALFIDEHVERAVEGNAIFIAGVALYCRHEVSVAVLDQMGTRHTAT